MDRSQSSILLNEVIEIIITVELLPEGNNELVDQHHAHTQIRMEHDKGTKLTCKGELRALLTWKVACIEKFQRPLLGPPLQPQSKPVNKSCLTPLERFLEELSHEHGIAFIRPPVADYSTLETYMEDNGTEGEFVETGEISYTTREEIEDDCHIFGNKIEEDIMQIGAGVAES